MLVDALRVLLPAALVAFGGLACLASEPFLRDADKHRVLPWTATVFLVLAGLAQCLIGSGLDGAVGLGALYAMDEVRSWLGLGIVVCSLAGVAGLQQSLRRDAFEGGEPYALMLFAATGGMLMVTAADLIALFVGLELTSLSIYASVGLRRHRREAGEGLLKYLVMGAVFSAIFLYGVALTYGATGTTGFISEALPGREPLHLLGTVLVMVGLLFKIGAVPFHFWSPDAYTGAPVPVVGFMAGVVKIGGFTALGSLWLGQLSATLAPVPELLDLSASIPHHLVDVTGLTRHQRIITVVAVLSLLLGNFSALGQTHLRRLMAFSSVSHAGYLLLAFALPGDNDLDLWNLWFYLVVYAVASAGLFAGLAGLCGRDDHDDLLDLAGAARRHPLLGLLLTILIATLAGFPPTAGFIAKYLILAELVATDRMPLAALAMVLAVVGAVYYLRLIILLWSGSGERVGARSPGGLAWAAVLLAVGVSLALVAGPPQAASEPSAQGASAYALAD